jgi:mRNA degradation ribonuclease J1/J2
VLEQQRRATSLALHTAVGHLGDFSIDGDRRDNPLQFTRLVQLSQEGSEVLSDHARTPQ